MDIAVQNFRDNKQFKLYFVAKYNQDYKTTVLANKNFKALKKIKFKKNSTQKYIVQVH